MTWKLALVLALASLSQGCATLYSAREIEAWVVDADTQQPLEGVNVVAHWAVHFGLEGGQQRDMEMMEAVTDKNGRFYFPAWGPKRVPSELPWGAYMERFDPELIFFKSGYEPRTAYNDRVGRPDAYGGSVRTSLWHGKKIAMKKFNGDWNRYTAITGGILTGVSWGGCGWTKIPRMMLALDQEAQRFKRMKLRHSAPPTISRLESTAKGEWCEAVHEILERARR